MEIVLWQNNVDSYNDDCDDDNNNNHNNVKNDNIEYLINKIE